MVKHKHISLATRLKELRRARGWTQQDLSRTSGLTRSYISRLEMGDIALPSSEKLRALSQALGTAPDDLLQAAGYIDLPSGASELPDVKVYLRRKYALHDAQLLQALETIILNFKPAEAAPAEAEQRGTNNHATPEARAEAALPASEAANKRRPR